MGFWNRLFGKKDRTTLNKTQEDFLKDEYRNETNDAGIEEAAVIEPPQPVQEPKNAPIKKEHKQEKKTELAKTKSSDKKSSKGFFEIKKAKDGRCVFNLYAANRVIIATSQIYSSSQSALSGIKSVIANCEKAMVEDTTLKDAKTLPYPKWEIYTDKAGAYRFRLNASNGSCICHSQGYTTKASCKNGIDSIIRTAKDASIDKAYLTKE